MLEIGCFFRVVREKRRNQAYSLPLKNNLSARSRPPVVRREVIWEMNVGLFRSSWTFSNPQPSPQGPPSYVSRARHIESSEETGDSRDGTKGAVRSR